jgi:hypothetical protein
VKRNAIALNASGKLARDLQAPLGQNAATRLKTMLRKVPSTRAASSLLVVGISVHQLFLWPAVTGRARSFLSLRRLIGEKSPTATSPIADWSIAPEAESEPIW